MRNILAAALLVGLAVTISACNTVYQNPAIPYVQRTDTVTFGASNTQDVNSAVQTIDPWPRYVGDRRIPGNGARIVGAVERYEGSAKGKPSGNSTNPAGGASSSGATGAPALFPIAPITPEPGG